MTVQSITLQSTLMNLTSDGKGRIRLFSMLWFVMLPLELSPPLIIFQTQPVTNNMTASDPPPPYSPPRFVQILSIFVLLTFPSFSLLKLRCRRHPSVPKTFQESILLYLTEIPSLGCESS